MVAHLDAGIVVMQEEPGRTYVPLGDEHVFAADEGTPAVDPLASSSPDAGTNTNALASNTLSLVGGIALCCADIIGSGIFASPGIVLHWSGSVGASLLLWLLAGVITFVGFACLAELSVLDPNAGGLFYYFRTTFGGAVAFSWTFINFTVVVPGSLGALSLTFAHYVASAVPNWNAGGFEAEADWRLKSVACAAVATVVALNSQSAAHGGGVAKVFLTATLLGCAFVFVLGVAFALGARWTSAEHYEAAAESPSNFDPHTLFAGTRGPSSLAVGLVSALWAYAGAMDVASMGEELREPEKTLPKVGMTGLGIVSAAYIGMNVAYLLVLPADVIDGSAGGAQVDAMGVTFARTVAGAWAGHVVTVVVAASSFGALNSCLYLSARQFYAAARDGLFPAALAVTNARAAPHRAIFATGTLTIALLWLLSSFATLVNYLSAAMWLYYGLVGVAVIVSRRKDPDVVRPYSMPGYPLVPALYVLMCTYLSACTFAAAPGPCAGALLFVAAAFPLHHVWFVWFPRRRRRLAAEGERRERGESRRSEGLVESLLGRDDTASPPLPASAPPLS